MPTKKKTTASALLDAHIAWLEERMTGDNLAPYIEKTLNDVLPMAAKLKLEDTVSRAAVKAVALEYASGMDISPAIPELVGEISNAVLEDEVLERTTLDQLASEKTIGELIDRVLEMEDLRAAIVRETVSNPIFSGMVSDLLYGGIKDYLTHNLPGRNLAVVKSATKIGKGVLKKARPGLEAEAEETIKAAIRKNIGTALKTSEQYLLDTSRDAETRDYVVDLWVQIKDEPASQLRGYLTGEDTEAAFILGFEFWKKLRKTEIYSTLIETGIDEFYNKYGKESLAVLLEEFGIDKDVMLREAMRFAPGVIANLKKRKQLIPLIKIGLEDFYQSDAVADILAQS